MAILENTKEDFEGKYLNSGFFIKVLIKRFFRQIEKIISGIEIESALEIGCGAGFSTEILAKILKGKNFEASDLMPDLVKEAQERNPEIKIKQESIYDLKRPDKSFDLVIALEVLEHLESPELALGEIKRVSGRYCLISCPQEPLWRVLNIFRFKYLKNLGNTPGHIQNFTKKEFLNLLSKYFRIKEVKTSLPWLIVLAEK